jgi:hypothetical protein
MRMIAAGVLLVLVGLGLWAIGGRSDPIATSSEATETTTVGGSTATTTTAPPTESSSTSSTSSTSMAVTSSTSLAKPDQTTTTTLGDFVGRQGYAGEVSEAPSGDQGEFPISSNLGEGVDYPLDPMVDLAVGQLRAATTGEGRERYPYLADMLAVCCRDLVVERAAVIFGETPTDPATVLLSWHAIERTSGEVRTSATRSLWWWVDGSWVGEFER